MKKNKYIFDTFFLSIVDQVFFRRYLQFFHQHFVLDIQACRKNYRSKLEKLLPEIEKYYGAKGWNVSLEAKDYYNRDQVRLNFYTARGGTLYF